MHEAPRRVNGLFESLLVSLSTISQVVPRLRQASRLDLLLHGSGVEGRLAAYETPKPLPDQAEGEMPIACSVDHGSRRVAVRTYASNRSFVQNFCMQAVLRRHYPGVRTHYRRAWGSRHTPTVSWKEPKAMR